MAGERVAVIVEDDADIRQLLETILTQGGFQVIACGNGQDGIDAVRRFDPVVVTLDVNMPGMDGFEVARRVRAFSSTYIIMLTALNDEIDTLRGLDAGADDFLTKPFRPRELRARIEAMLRRPRMVVETAAALLRQGPGGSSAGSSAMATSLGADGTADVAPAAMTSPTPSAPTLSAPTLSASTLAAMVVPAPVFAAMPAPVFAAMPAPVFAAPPPTVPTVPTVPSAPPSPTPTPPRPPTPAAASLPGGEGWLEHNGLWLNIETHIVNLDGQEIALTRSEFDLLASMLQSHRRVRTKPDLVLMLRGEGYVTGHYISDADKRAVEVHMGNLRKKLADSVAAPRFIETVRGVGYRLTVPESS
ncbi:MAG: response regulator transcription factor [Burkholderiaceae bacterium]|nr:response regulator transcription factor [Microbacteriaceae bacterium]